MNRITHAITAAKIYRLYLGDDILSTLCYYLEPENCIPATMSAKLPGNIINGVVFPPFVTQQHMDELKAFPLRLDDVMISCLPKSGTTWLRQITKLIRTNGKENGVKLPDAVPSIETNSKPFYWVDINNIPSPRTIKTHAPYQMTPGGLPHTTAAKYIYIARNPKDLAVSFYYHVRGFKHHHFTGTFGEYLELFIEGKNAYGSWFDHVLGWWKHKDSPNILFIKYEDMKKDTPAVIKKIAEFMGCNLEAEVIKRIAEQTDFGIMKDNPAANFSWMTADRIPSEPPFMRKGVVGDWKNHFTEEQSAMFDALYSEKMKGSGLDFDFE